MRSAEQNNCAEGELYKVLNVCGQSFILYYGYYDECDRRNPLVEPMPIYPDFLKNPVRLPDGTPFVTKMQDACSHYIGVVNQNEECAECIWYRHGEELLGTCSCPENKMTDCREQGGNAYDR